MTQTPLKLNASSSLLQNTGFNINSTTATYMGSSKTNSAYTPGTTVTTTCLNKLTSAINLGYLAYVATTITSTTYNNLISIGSSTIPALGNSKPPTYIISDPSGQWSGQVNTGYAISGSVGQGQSATWIPYDTTNTNVAVTQWGYLRLHALQAWTEFNYNNDNATGSVNYQDFTYSFTACDSFLNNTNASITALSNASTFLQGTYSNMNDLISADLTGVSLATTAFGQDCINLGKVIDLSSIQKFGLPSVLLQTIRKYNALTQSLSLALLSTGMKGSDIEAISKGTMIANEHQEQQIYGAFLIIVGQDLLDILIPLNCHTKNITALSDLLVVSKLFPNSYPSITVPVYNIIPTNTNSKTYYPIYIGTGVNSKIVSPEIQEQIGTIVIPGTPVPSNTTTDTIQVLPKGFGSNLVNILPYDVAVAAGAFAYSMMQIKNIQQVNFEKFAQVMANIETTKDLNSIGGTDVPVDTTLTSQGLSILALGSGTNGTYTTADFFGCMSGTPYNWDRLTTLITNTQTTTLSTIYTNLYNTLVAGGAGLDAAVQSYITQANTEISNIYNSTNQYVAELNSLYQSFGTQLMIEQRARYIALAPVPVPRDSRLSATPMSVMSFVDTLNQCAQNTMPCMQAQTIQAISDTTTIGGQSVIGAMREARNTTRLSLLGIPQDNKVPSQPTTEQQKEAANDNSCIGSGPSTALGQYNNNNYVIDGQAIPTGKGYPGSFAGSPATNLVPIPLNITYASNVIPPATYSVPEAIDNVVACNCDCWVN